MHRILELLKAHPMVGMATTLGGAWQAFMQTSTPILQFLALVLGVAIGALTLAIKFREWRKAK